MKPMRATMLEESDLDSLTYPLYGSPKYDGIRAITTNDGVRSKSLKPIRNSYIQEHLFPIGLDGELVIGRPGVDDTFDLTRRGVMSSAGEPDFHYYIFDVWDSQLGLHDRLAIAGIEAGLHGSSRLSVIPHKELHSARDVLEYESRQLAAGHEGIVLRAIHGNYKYGDTTLREQYSMKLVRFHSSEAVIVGFVEECENTNEATRNAIGRVARSSSKAGKVPKGICGALIVVANEFNNEFKVSGFSKEFGRELMENQNKYLGQIVTFTYKAVGSTADAPRMPKFKGIRHPEDM
jgi:DNA ligase-1